jgi:hypothetical protein
MGVLRISKKGESYVGGWSYGKKNGKGILKLPDSLFEGGWKDDRKDGRGIQRFSNGSVLEGEWELGDLRGEVSFTSRSGAKLSCRWDSEENFFLGQGSFQDGPHSSYEGEYLIDTKTGKTLPHGQGTGDFEDGSRYEGKWKEGYFEKGILTYPDKTIYEGGFRKKTGSDPAVFFLRPLSEPQGLGTATFPDGTRCYGPWHDGILHGQGTIAESGKKAQKAVWIQGRIKDRFWPDLRMKSDEPAPSRQR